MAPKFFALSSQKNVVVLNWDEGNIKKGPFIREHYDLGLGYALVEMPGRHLSTSVK